MPKLRTYAEACEELGGVPWQRIDQSERWFVPIADERPITLDTGAILIGRRGMFAGLREVQRSTWLIVIAAGALLAFAAVLLG
jgi:hypothetical protein